MGMQTPSVQFTIIRSKSVIYFHVVWYSSVICTSSYFISLSSNAIHDKHFIFCFFDCDTWPFDAAGGQTHCSASSNPWIEIKKPGIVYTTKKICTMQMCTLFIPSNWNLWRADLWPTTCDYRWQFKFVVNNSQIIMGHATDHLTPKRYTFHQNGRKIIHYYSKIFWSTEIDREKKKCLRRKKKINKKKMLQSHAKRLEVNMIFGYKIINMIHISSMISRKKI